MLNEDVNYVIVDPSGNIVAAYPDLETAVIDAEDLSKDLPDKLVHIFTKQNIFWLDENQLHGTHNYMQVTYKHFRSYPLPPSDTEPEAVEVVKELEPVVEVVEDEAEDEEPEPEAEELPPPPKEVECEDCGAIWPFGTETCDDCEAPLPTDPKAIPPKEPVPEKEEEPAS